MMRVEKSSRLDSFLVSEAEYISLHFIETIKWFFDFICIFASIK